MYKLIIETKIRRVRKIIQVDNILCDCHFFRDIYLFS